MKGPRVLYHGSSDELIGEKLNPSQGEDLDIRPENNLLAVYGTDRKDLAIVMGILGCRDVFGGSIEKYKGDELNAVIYGDFPKQEFIYLHYLSPDTFEQTKIDKHQFVSEVAVKPIKTVKVKIKDYVYLFRVGSEEEKKEWALKYK